MLTLLFSSKCLLQYQDQLKVSDLFLKWQWIDLLLTLNSYLSIVSSHTKLMNLTLSSLLVEINVISVYFIEKFPHNFQFECVSKRWENLPKLEKWYMLEQCWKQKTYQIRSHTKEVHYLNFHRQVREFTLLRESSFHQMGRKITKGAAYFTHIYTHIAYFNHICSRPLCTLSVANGVWNSLQNLSV